MLYSDKKTMYSYNINSELWSQLPDCPNYRSAIAVINSLLTTIGGVISGQYSNILYSLKQQAQQLATVG